MHTIPFPCAFSQPHPSPCSTAGLCSPSPVQQSSPKCKHAHTHTRTCTHTHTHVFLIHKLAYATGPAKINYVRTKNC